MSLFFYDPDLLSSFDCTYVPHQGLVTSSSKTKPRMISGSVFDCQLARRVPQEFFSDSRSLSASSGIQRREGIEKSGSEEPLQPVPSSCISGKAQEVWTTEIVSSLRLTMPRVSGLVLEVSPLHPVMKFKDYRDCSVLNGRTTLFSGF